MYLPVPFIIVQDSEYKLSQEARVLLESIDNEVGIAVILGEPSSGKTTLVNQITGTNTVSSAAQPVSVIYRMEAKSENLTRKGCDILIIEFNKLHLLSTNHQNHLVLLSILISSQLVFNTRGEIGQSAIEPLFQIVSDLRSSLKDIEVQQIFPSLLWILRDFNTVECFQTPKQYMEKCLELQKGSSEQVESANKLKRVIKNFIKDRDCYMMNHPEAKSEYTSFNIQVEVLRDRLVSKVKPIQVEGKYSTSKIMLELVLTFLQKINKQQRLSISQIYQQIRQSQNQKILSLHVKQLQSHLGGYPNKVGEVVVQTLKQELSQSILTSFSQHVFGTHQQSLPYLNTLTNKLHQNLRNFERQNSFRWLQYYRGQFVNLTQKYFNNIGKVAEVQVKFRMLREQFNQNTETNSSREVTLDRLQLQFIRQNVYGALQRIVSQNAQTQDYKKMYQQIVSYHKTYTKLNNQKAEQIESTLARYRAQLSTYKDRVSTLESQIQILQSNNSNLAIIKGEQQNLLVELDKKTTRIEVQLGHKVEESFAFKAINQSNCKQIERLNQCINDLEIGRQRLDVELKNKCLDMETLDLQLRRTQEQVDYLTSQSKKLVDGLARESSRQQKVSSNSTLYKEEIKFLNCKVLQLDSDKLKLEQELIRHTKDKAHADLRLTEVSQIFRQKEQLNSKTISSLKTNLQFEADNKRQLMETNQNLVHTLTSMEERTKQFQARLQQFKEVKKALKNAVSFQCSLCKKSINASLFASHFSTCCENVNVNQNQNQNQDTEKENSLGIEIKRTVIHEENNKPFTVYQIQVCTPYSKWTVFRKYKDFCELHSSLKSVLQGVQVSTVSFIVCPQEGMKKQLNSAQRKKYLQQYLQQVSTNLLVSQSKCFKEFIQNPSKVMSKSNSRELFTRKYPRNL